MQIATKIEQMKVELEERNRGLTKERNAIQDKLQPLETNYKEL